MKKIECFRCTKALLRQKRTGLILVFWILGFFFLCQGSIKFYFLKNAMEEQVELLCTIQSPKEVEHLRQMEGILDISHYEKKMAIADWKSYTAEVTLVGMDREYLRKYYGSGEGIKGTGTMPYAVVETDVFHEMRNEDKKELSPSQKSEMLSEIFMVDGKEVRISGIRESNQPVIYVSSEDYERITKLSSEEMEEGTETGLEPEQYCVMAKNGFFLEEIRKKCDERGYQVEILKEPYLLQNWKEEKHSAVQSLWIAFLAVFCGGCLVLEQGKTWEWEYGDFIRYIRQIDKNHRTWKWMKNFRWLWYMGYGSVLGIFIYFLKYMLTK